ncbi:hypothetical protein QOT17_017230 [Balamuthia mandrillaris]
MIAVNDCDMAYCSSVSLRMIGQDEPVLKARECLKSFDDCIDKLSAIVRLKDLRKTEIRDDLIEGVGHIFSRLGMDWAEGSESIEAFGRSRKWAKQINGNVIKGVSSVDSFERMKAVFGDIVLNTVIARWASVKTVSTKSRPMIAFIPDLDEQGFCSMMSLCVKQLQEAFSFRGGRELLAESALDVPIKNGFGCEWGVVNQGESLEVVGFVLSQAKSV